MVAPLENGIAAADNAKKKKRPLAEASAQGCYPWGSY
jgi:hypothetical protein